MRHPKRADVWPSGDSKLTSCQTGLAALYGTSAIDFSTLFRCFGRSEAVTLNNFDPASILRGG